MITLRITGMTCNNCVKHVTHALESVPGAENVKVSLDEGLARVEGQPELAALQAAVEEEGYEAAPV